MLEILQSEKRWTFCISNFIDSPDYLLCVIILFCMFVGWLQNKNFDLKEVVKLNIQPREFYCMTFEAWDAESHECQFFRGVVYCAMSGRDDVLLCEIKVPSSLFCPS